MFRSYDTRYSSSLTCLAFLILWSPGEAGVAAAQPAPQGAPADLEVVLHDSRGPMHGTTLVVGRDLRVGLSGARPEHLYRFIVLDEAGGRVAERVARTDAAGVLEPVEVWDRTGIVGCNSPPKSWHEYPFANYAQATAALGGRTFELVVVDPQIRPPVVSLPLGIQEPEEAIYYWSDDKGNTKCLFETAEPVYLTVFHGHLEAWDANSRVFMLEAPPSKDLWQDGMSFKEVRLQPDCQGGIDVCAYPQGTIEPIPQQSTIELQGILPDEGGFLAIIRRPDGLLETQRYACDRATESVMYIKNQPVDLNDSDDGWGCPPCPP